MKISSISDVHLSKFYPERFRLFSQFCHSKEVQSSDVIILLGDIFDVMTGNKNQYILKYREFFDELGLLLQKGKKLIVVEGNHDFHTDKIYYNFFKKYYAQYIDNYSHVEADIIYEANNKKIYIGHGDVLDYKNDAYKKWKRIYTSKWFRFLVSYILPFWFIEMLGDRASKNSKKRSRDSFNVDSSRALYREGFQELIRNKSIDIALTGHTHIDENLLIDGKKLMNNGFFPATMSFVHITDNESTLVKLEGSSK